MQPFIGYAPDLDPATPGVLTDVVNMVPTAKGLKGAPTPVDEGIAALSAESRGLAVLSLLDATRRTFAGTATGLYEAISSAWTDRSKGGGYALGTDDRWVFVQFGNATIAAAVTETLQASTTGAFADITGAPKATLIAVSEGFVMAANLDDLTNGYQSDRWKCCAYGDYTDWTLDVATQCVSGRLIDSPGPIYAMEALGASFVAYKKDSIFIGSYVGAPTVWQWNQVPGYVGCLGKDVVVNAGYAHIFLGSEDFYLMDGTRPISIGAPIREWFFANINQKYAYKTQGAYDEENGNAYWWYVPRANTAGTLTAAIVYNVKFQRWGKLDLTIESVGKYVNAGVTYSGLGALYTTYNDLPDISYNSPYWAAETPVLSVIKTDQKLYTLTGDSTSCSLTTGIIGDDETYSFVSRVKPRFITVPTSATMESQYDDAFGTSFTTNDTVSLTNYVFDMMKSARWHRFIETFVGPVEIIGQTYDIKQAGKQ